VFIFSLLIIICCLCGKTWLLSLTKTIGAFFFCLKKIHPRDDDSSEAVPEVEVHNAENKANAMIDNLVKKPFQEMYLTRMVRAKVEQINIFSRFST